MRKRRTREHVIADLGVNHIERFALLCGFSVQRVAHDYGYDLNIYTYNEHGEAESGQILVQLKATDALPLLRDGTTVSFDKVERKDLELWLAEVNPVLLILYDAQADRAYWVDVQDYFASRADFALTRVNVTATVHMDKTSIVNEHSMREFRARKARALERDWKAG